MDIENWLIFIGVWTAAGLPLGPNAVNCISVAAGQGMTRALWSIAGILLAACGFMAATVLGVAAVLLAHDMLFRALQFAGAAYLVWMGVQLWRRRDGGLRISGAAPVSAVRLVLRASLISLSNPKAILSYFAVFSQFVRPGPGLLADMALLVPTALIVTALIYLGYAAAGAGIGRLLSSLRRRLIFNRAIGSLYVLAGLGLASAGAQAAPVPGR